MALSAFPGMYIDLGATGQGERYTVDFETYRTVAFESEFMQKLIGLGDAVIGNDGQFYGFDSSRNPGMLNLSVWIAFVPEAYREDVEYGAMYPIWDRFMREKIDGTLIRRYVEALREWIAYNVVPTYDRRPRRERFAAAWYEIGVQESWRMGKNTPKPPR